MILTNDSGKVVLVKKIEFWYDKVILKYLGGIHDGKRSSIQKFY